MLKIIAIFLVAVVLILAGQYVNNRMKKRINSLRDLIVLIDNIDSYISFSRKTIQEIIKDLISGGDLNLKTMSQLLESGNEDFSENWKITVRKFFRDDCLNKEDEKILQSFGKTLGVTDTNGQNSNCRLHRLMLEKQLQEAADKVKEKAKTNTAISFFLALSVVIIFC